MKKYLISIVVILAVIFGNFGLVKANDGGPDSAFWMESDKITCMSVTNPENIKAGHFLVFDYSPSIGQKLGKPWAVVEKGKCYEADKDGGLIYNVQVVNGNEKQQFENYKAYKPTDNIPQIFCKGISACNYDEPIVVDDFLQDKGVTLEYSDIIFDTGIRANDIFPTKYDFGNPITSYNSTPSKDPVVIQVVSDPSYIQAGALYRDLAEDLQNKLQSCDTRVRVEYQAQVDPLTSSYLVLKNLVWRLSDNKDISLNPKKIDPFQAIDFMGCKKAFGQYIESHKTDFAKINTLAEEVVKKYPSAVGDNYPQPLKKRDQKTIDKILSFASNLEVVGNNLSGEPVVSTSLDEPTPEKKTDILFNSSNPLMKTYILLPIVAFIGIIIFFFLRRRLK